MSRPQLPLSFVLRGVPKSVQARRSSVRAWKESVKAAASAAMGSAESLDSEVSVVIVYFYRAGSLDVDNIIKPILDGMNLVVFEDDRLISQITARKTEITTGLQIQDAKPDLLEAFDEVTDFVYVTVLPPPDHGVLP